MKTQRIIATNKDVINLPNGDRAVVIGRKPIKEPREETTSEVNETSQEPTIKYRIIEETVKPKVNLLALWKDKNEKNKKALGAKLLALGAKLNPDKVEIVTKQ